MGIFVYSPQSKPSNPLPTPTPQQVNQGVQQSIQPLTGPGPLPLPKQYLEQQEAVRTMIPVTPGALTRVGQGMDYLQKSVDLYNSINQATTGNPQVDIVAELRCMNELTKQSQFNREAQVEFFQGFLRAIAHVCAEIRFHAVMRSETFMLDPINLEYPDGIDGNFVRGFIERLVDEWSDAGRTKELSCVDGGG